MVYLIELVTIAKHNVSLVKKVNMVNTMIESYRNSSFEPFMEVKMVMAYHSEINISIN